MIPRLGMRQVSWLLLCLIVDLAVVVGQDDMGGGDEDGGGDILDMESMMGGDKNKNAGEGLPKKSLLDLELSYIEQTSRALQQLALVIGVAFMVAFLFMLMIGAERLWEALEEKYRDAYGTRKIQEDDPAALVGTFKRYKN